MISSLEWPPGGPLSHIGLRFLVDADTADHGQVQCGVGLSVPAPVEPVTSGHSRRCGQLCDTAQLGKAGLGAEPARVVAGRDQQLPGDLDPDPDPVQQLRGERGDQGVRSARRAQRALHGHCRWPAGCAQGLGIVLPR
jgi:hypothetical protein